jgi:signal transduction histidine kinase
MLTNLGIALKKQRRLILIFFLTIFIPALALGIFGIRAIKNERFRQAREVENENRQAAERIKSRISTELGELGFMLQNLAESASFKNRDEKAIAGLVRDQLTNNPLVKTVFYSYENGEARFPAFYGALGKATLKTPSLPAGPVQEVLNRAREQEFSRKDFRRAIALYRSAGRQAKDRDIQARMLFNEARCLMKLERYAEAIKVFQRVENEHPESTTASGMPLSLVSRLEEVHSHAALGDTAGALRTSLTLYEDLIGMRWAVSKAQFKTYAGLVEEAIDEILSKKSAVQDLAGLQDRYSLLKARLQEKDAEWKIMNTIQQEVVPDLRRRASTPDLPSPIKYSKTIGGRAFIVLAAPIIETPRRIPFGLIGLMLKGDFLLNNVLSRAVANDLPATQTELVVSDLEGNVLLGSDALPAERATVTEFFDDNFPPWKLEFYARRPEGIGFAGLQNSFYFWTILTLVVVLTFGAILIGRTIAHEMEILKLKADFVSSVSHEFKTPLTSIKTLTERLQGDKAIDPGRMRQYFSLISQNADQLTHLVKNLLDFSKIEEGKKEYHFEAADVAKLLTQQIRDYRKDDPQKGARIKAAISDDIPPLLVDRDALSQALNNLLDNAFKFSSGDGDVEVHLNKEKNSVMIEVSDHGIGIPPDELEKIFDKFYQAKNAIKHSAKGTGLGLTLVKHTAEAHGGKVSVRSKVGEGSAFSLILPIKKE